MSKRTVRTRFTTGCGHSWTRKYPRRTISDLAGSTTDCDVCGKLLIVPGGQFVGVRLDCVPAEVHMPLLHRWLNQKYDHLLTDDTNLHYAGIEEPDGALDENGYPAINCMIVTTERMVSYAPS